MPLVSEASSCRLIKSSNYLCIANLLLLLFIIIIPSLDNEDVSVRLQWISPPVTPHSPPLLGQVWNQSIASDGEKGGPVLIPKGTPFLTPFGKKKGRSSRLWNFDVFF